MDYSHLREMLTFVAIGAAVVFGAIAIGSASWVWLRKNLCGYGGSALCVAGIVLIGLPVWKSVEVSASAKEMKLKLEEVTSELASTKKQLAAVQTEIDKNAVVTQTLVKAQTPGEEEDWKYIISKWGGKLPQEALVNRAFHMDNPWGTPTNPDSDKHPALGPKTK